MVTLVAEHWIKPEFMERALKIFRDNTEKGDFVSRLVLRSMDDPSKITTVTTWETEGEYKKFLDDLAKIYAQRDPNAPKSILGEKLEGYEVVLSG